MNNNNYNTNAQLIEEDKESSNLYAEAPVFQPNPINMSSNAKVFTTQPPYQTINDNNNQIQQIQQINQEFIPYAPPNQPSKPKLSDETSPKLPHLRKHHEYIGSIDVSNITDIPLQNYSQHDSYFLMQLENEEIACQELADFDTQIQLSNEDIPLSPTSVLAQKYPNATDIKVDMEPLITDANKFRKTARYIQPKISIGDVMKYSFCFICIGIIALKNKIIKWTAQRKLVDNVFTDLENMFYFLSKTVINFQHTPYKNKKSNIFCWAIMNLIKILVLMLVIYPLVIILSIITILPSLFFLLIVRMTKIETDTKNLNIRQIQLESESICQRFCRLFSQFMRSSFVFSFIAIYPIIITYIIIPKYGNSDYIILTSIGSYLVIILLLQSFGTYRGLKSFKEKNKKLKNIEQQFTPQKFQWNIGSLICLTLLVYETFQFLMFATHVINNESIDTQNSNQTLQISDIQSDNKIILFLIKISYISFEFVDTNILEFYSFFNIFCVGTLLLFFAFRFMFELKKYGKLKYVENKIDCAQQFYFHSFVGSIIYGHGTLKNLSPFACKIVGLLSDTLFLIICEKLIMVLSCTSPSDSNDNISYLRIDDNIVCWEGKHKLYATINLILIGYYVPISVMIAPMFAEENEQRNDKQNKNRWCCARFFSFSNTIRFVKPFISSITLTKCFMMITSTFLFRNNSLWTLICQSLSMVLLLLFTIIWSFNDIKLSGLTQNQPGFPFSVSLIRIVGFLCGLSGCIIELLRYHTDYIDSDIDLIVLISILIFSFILMAFVLIKYHSKYEKLGNNVNIDWIIHYDLSEKNKNSNNNVKVIKFYSDKQNLSPETHGDDKLLFP